MNMTESSRIIEGLYKEGWDADKICKFILWIERGDERVWEDYPPKKIVEKK